MNILVLNDQVSGYLCDILADLLFFQHTQVNRLDFNTWKCWQSCHYIELSEYKLYMGHIHTLVLTRGWIAMLGCFLIILNLKAANKLFLAMLA